jgi:hypothetical protein
MRRIYYDWSLWLRLWRASGIRDYVVMVRVEPDMTGILERMSLG